MSFFYNFKGLVHSDQTIADVQGGGVVLDSAVVAAES
jgi:hypothetical protein